MNEKADKDVLHKPLSWEEWNDIAKRLDAATPVFYMMWKLGRPIYSNRIDTACVSFNKDGNCIGFEINPEFWGKLTPDQKAFIISHECMHVVLNHGIRAKNLLDKSVLMDCANRAMDVVINEMLVSNYFDRKALGDFSEKLCWYDTCFSKQDNIERDQNFEYYYNKLSNQVPKGGKGDSGEGGGKGDSGEADKGGQLLDDHSGLWDKNADWEKLEDYFNQISENCSAQDLQKFVDKIQKQIEQNKQEQISRGTSPGGGFLIVKLAAVKPKKKWETVINKWARKQIKDADKDHEQWARLNRRFALMDGEMFIPTEIEIEDRDEEEKKVDVWFFQDTSGSCAHLAPRFFKAAKSLPKKSFNIRMFCFDTQVYETSLASGKLYGFGGTSFTCIEQKIQQIISKEKVKYPKAVFVITDGAGDVVRPQYPKSWYWFLSHDCRYCIPKESPVYMLSNFE